MQVLKIKPCKSLRSERREARSRLAAEAVPSLVRYKQVLCASSPSANAGGNNPGLKELPQPAYSCLRRPDVHEPCQRRMTRKSHPCSPIKTASQTTSARPSNAFYHRQETPIWTPRNPQKTENGTRNGLRFGGQIRPPKRRIGPLEKVPIAFLLTNQLENEKICQAEKYAPKSGGQIRPPELPVNPEKKSIETRLSRRRRAHLWSNAIVGRKAHPCGGISMGYVYFNHESSYKNFSFILKLPLT